MNYFFSKYSQNQNPPAKKTPPPTPPITIPNEQDVLKSDSDSSINNSTPTTNKITSNQVTPISLNKNTNKTTMTEILSLSSPQITSTNTSNINSNLAIPQNNKNSQMFITPTSTNNINKDVTNTNFVLPALSQPNLSMPNRNKINNANTPNFFNNNTNNSDEFSLKSNYSTNKNSSTQLSLSLMNQNFNGNNLRNKLSDYGDVLAKLNNGDSNNSNRPQALTPLTSKLTLNFDSNQSAPSRRPDLKQFDFRSDANNTVATKKQLRPNQLSFPSFKSNIGSNTNSNEKNTDEILNGNFSSRQIPTPPRLEQVNADKYREILKNAGYLLINGQRIKTSMDDLTSISELGSGTCGQVYKMVHNPTGYIMAVKQMGITGVAEENKRIIMDLDVVLKSHDCADIVKCLGYFISECDVWICMELMAMCFDKLLKLVKQPIPEEILGKMSVSTINALNYLKQTHNVIHRDIKPSNILINENGQIKLCDFGISGNLINSNAKSRNNAGCAGYMAPERIDPPDHTNPVYDIRADVWSLGLTLVELATGEYPYKKCKNEFEVMSTILYQDAPTKKLDSDQFEFTTNFKSFVNKCLVKDVNKRPKYNILLQHPFILQYKDPDLEIDVKDWFKKATTNGLSRSDLTPVSSLSNLTIGYDCESTSTTPTGTSNSITSI